MTPIRHSKKVMPREALAEVIAQHKSNGQRVALCHGVFDLLHPGHLRHLQEGRDQADFLAVSITADAFVNKGPGRPVFNQTLRSEALAALEFVDYVTINPESDSSGLIQILKPDVYVKGSEYRDAGNDLTGKISAEEKSVRDVGGSIHFTDDIVFSSSSMINQFLNPLPHPTVEWLEDFKTKFSIADISRYLEDCTRLKVLVIGEAIIDEYIYCESLGKATKDPMLAIHQLNEEHYLGGSLAVANHLAPFCEKVTLLTQIGEIDSRRDLIREKIKPHVELELAIEPNAPTIRKTRYVDTGTSNRLLEIYHMKRDPLCQETCDNLVMRFNRLVDQHDLVIVADYGHGLMHPALIRAVCERSKFLCLNVQSNAGNRGFNTISKYSRADYVCLAGHEAMLETRMINGTAKELMDRVRQSIESQHFTLTLGKNGTIHHSEDGKSARAPSFATHVKDKVGAGDSVLALTSLLLSCGAPWEVVGFLGNLAGAQLVEEIGNKKTLDRVALIKAVDVLLK